MIIEKDVDRILVSKSEIAKRVKELALEMDEFYQGEEVVLVCILKGAVTFFSDLVRSVSFPVQFDFMCVSSYGSGSVSTGDVQIKKDLSVDISGKNVLLVEDILDTGNTMMALIELLKERNPKDIKLCTFLNKPARREQPIEADFCGFDIPDEFVIGYGLDYDERYRQMPYIGVLKREVYE
ncbi:MAG: hypoxanthine phosphoribosyltransferase [Ruminococcaceae bacterium]|nr:hypoxanthine phosphoribosyltransferase [Oscillospiraceae bacterium]